MADGSHASLKGLREGWIIEAGQEEKQGPASDVLHQKSCQLLEIGIHNRADGMPRNNGLDGLPMPAMKDGERPVKMSPDRRQVLCYQCHAPRAGMQVFSGDDRTPIGVHEGLSCQACHAKHGQSTRASCAGCHPRLSNCGIDVEKMDTTFKSPDSLHDVHRVACLDCHPKGVPKKSRSRG